MVLGAAWQWQGYTARAPYAIRFLVAASSDSFAQTCMALFKMAVVITPSSSPFFSGGDRDCLICWMLAAIVCALSESAWLHTTSVANLLPEATYA